MPTGPRSPLRAPLAPPEPSAYPAAPHAPRAVAISEATLAEFTASMPDDYLARFDARARREHARIVAARRAAPAHVDLWRSSSKGACLVVVADDRPGLLARISAALVAHDLDVLSALAYGRHRAGARDEAVDFFWVRRTHQAPEHRPVDRLEAASVSEILRRLLVESATLDALVRTVTLRRNGVLAATRVAFAALAAPAAHVATLEVECADRPALLLVVTRALARARVQIVWSEVASEAGRIHDRFGLVEPDGAALAPRRLREIETRVREALDAALGAAFG